MQRILGALLARGPMTAEVLSKTAFVSVTTLTGGGYLRHMKSAGKLHISGWAPTLNNGFAVPIYSAGAGVDAERPRMTDVDRNTLLMRKIEEFLDDNGDATPREIAVGVEVTLDSLCNGRYMEILELQGRVHVADWQRSQNGGPFVPVFRFGKGRRKERPKPFSEAEKARRYRQRKRLLSEDVALLPLVLYGIAA